MEEKLKTVLQRLAYQPDAGLAGRIWGAILRRSRRRAALRISATSLAGLLSGAGLYEAGRALFAALARSGFYQYLSLAFSGHGIFSAYSKDVVLSIAESLPAGTLIVTLILTLAVVVSVGYLCKRAVWRASFIM